jgi:hypothetical protein
VSVIYCRRGRNDAGSRSVSRAGGFSWRVTERSGHFTPRKASVVGRQWPATFCQQQWRSSMWSSSVAPGRRSNDRRRARIGKARSADTVRRQGRGAVNLHASIAAELFDCLGLRFFGIVCRSRVTRLASLLLFPPHRRAPLDRRRAAEPFACGSRFHGTEFSPMRSLFPSLQSLWHCLRIGKASRRRPSGRLPVPLSDCPEDTAPPPFLRALLTALSSWTV